MIAELNVRLASAALPRVDFDIDDDGFVTAANPILPPIGEIILQTIATGVIVFLIVKFAGPAIKKYYADRSTNIQRNLDDAHTAREAAEAEAARIRGALGDIEAERARYHAEAEQQASTVLTEGRRRIEEEIAELEARAAAEVEGLANRSGDELRHEIARHAGRAVDVVVAETLDDATQQQLIEDFIARVGASTPANGASA